MTTMTPKATDKAANPIFPGAGTSLTNATALVCRLVRAAREEEALLRSLAVAVGREDADEVFLIARQLAGIKPVPVHDQSGSSD